MVLFASRSHYSLRQGNGKNDWCCHCMKIVIINTYDIQGGAARAAYRLHTGLTHRGHDSIMLVRYKSSSDNKVLAVETNMPADAEDEVFGCEMLSQYYIEQNRSELSNTLFSFPYPGCDIAEHPAIKTADVLNLHWISFFQSPSTIRKLLNLGKPIIWTMHDQNAFTGGCHYSAGCTGYESDCIPCPQLVKDPNCLPAAVLNEKRSMFNSDNLFIVSPSRWLAECARKSCVFMNRRTEAIPNALDVEMFQSHDKIKAKKSFGLEADDVLVLVGADSGRERRKGFHIVREVITRCLQDLHFCKLVKEGRMHLFAFGSHQEKIDHMGFPVRKLGHIKDDHELSVAYAAADLFLFPSLEDNLPNTILESLSCGTPVLAFATGGVPEIIEDSVDGYLIPAFDISLMTARLLDCICNASLLSTLSANARKKAEMVYALDIQASSYEKLFLEAIHRSSIKTISVRATNSISDSASSIIGMSSQLKKTVESTVFLINKSLVSNLRKVQADLSCSQKQLAEVLEEKSDMYRQVLFLQHQVNCLSTGRGALHALLRRITHKLGGGKFQRTEEQQKTEKKSLGTEGSLSDNVHSILFDALAKVRSIQANVDEKTLLSLYSFGTTVRRILCIEPTVDMVQASWIMSCAGADVLCIGDNHELHFASKAKLDVYYGDIVELLHSSGRIALTDYDCILISTKGVHRIAWLLADAAHYLPTVLTYRSELSFRYSLPQYALERSIGDFLLMRSTYIYRDMIPA